MSLTSPAIGIVAVSNFLKSLFYVFRVNVSQILIVLHIFLKINHSKLLSNTVVRKLIIVKHKVPREYTSDMMRRYPPYYVKRFECPEKRYINATNELLLFDICVQKTALAPFTQ